MHSSAIQHRFALLGELSVQMHIESYFHLHWETSDETSHRINFIMLQISEFAEWTLQLTSRNPVQWLLIVFGTEKLRRRLMWAQHIWNSMHEWKAPQKG